MSPYVIFSKKGSILLQYNWYSIGFDISNAQVSTWRVSGNGKVSSLIACKKNLVLSNFVFKFFFWISFQKVLKICFVYDVTALTFPYSFVVFFS